MTNFRILFLGTAPFGIPTLKKISTSGHDLTGVYTSPPKKANRGMKISKSPVALYAEDNNLNVYSPKELRSIEEIKNIKVTTASNNYFKSDLSTNLFGLNI